MKDDDAVFLLDDHEMVPEPSRHPRNRRRHRRDRRSGLVDKCRGIVGMRPDVALVDVVLPDGNGVKVYEPRAYAPDVRTLVLTSFSDDDARGNRCRRSRRCRKVSAATS